MSSLRHPLPSDLSGRKLHDVTPRILLKIRHLLLRKESCVGIRQLFDQ
jgi:hypothetical protein